MDTTVGKMLLNDLLPEDLQDHSRVIDKKTIASLFEEVANRYPGKYVDINQKMHELAADSFTTYGRSASFSLDSFKTPDSVRAVQKEITEAVQGILKSKETPEKQHEKIIALVGGRLDEVTDLNYKEGLKENNPLAIQVLSGSRGNAQQFRSLRGGDMLVTDHKDRSIPIPILASYSEGLDPAQYWAGAYGARKGEVAKKFATPKAGYLGKQLSAAAHRIMVTEKDCGGGTGIPVLAADPDNEGTVLAFDSGTYKAGTVLTPRMLKDLGESKIVVRSPMTCTAEQGVCQHCAGIRERGGFPPLGDNVGIAAAQAISEPIGQGQMNVRHAGGVASQGGQAKKDPLDLINQLVQVPATFRGAAAITTMDGRVESIKAAPQGGNFVTVGGTEHWVPADQPIAVRKGDVVEAGDVLSTGIPNPALVAQYKGIGEGRRYFAEQFKKALSDNKFAANRRNVEIMARGLVNHVRVTDLDGPNDTLPDDVVEYDSIARGYKPRFGFKMLKPKDATGLYLEKPVLHYSIGTKITPRVSKTLDDQKISEVYAHADQPSFVPEMSRAMETLAHSDDWMVRMGGLYGVKRSVLKGVHRGATSELHGTSYIPPLAQGIEFGKDPKHKGY